jgi:hypothetical protein
MATQPTNPPDQQTPREFAPQFPRAHKQALGFAVGITISAIIVGLTIFHVVLRPPRALPLELLNQYFYGYDVSWKGAAIGGAWGFATGFVGGWLLAFVHNFTVGAWILLVRAKHDLQRMRDFLDHI